jgi:hypothetical protein
LRASWSSFGVTRYEENALAADMLEIYEVESLEVGATERRGARKPSFSIAKVAMAGLVPDR